MPALVFDCDGVLAETERDGHLVAFNRAFAERGLPVRWSEDEYGELLKVGGGKERLSTVLTPAFAREHRLPAEPEALRRLVAELHARKTEIFEAIVAEGTLPARPGVRRLAAEADAARWRLAVASTSAEPSVRAVLEQVAGPELAARFAVFAGDLVPAKKPDPGIYELAVARLGAAPARTIVVEDSRIGLLAAAGAGLRCVVTPSCFTRGQDFSEAVLVVTCLGDPGEPAEVLADRAGAAPGELVTLGELEACLAAALT